MDWDLAVDGPTGIIKTINSDGSQVLLPRESLYYSMELLADGSPEQMDRAIKTIEQVLKTQQTDSNSDAFGYWPASSTIPVTTRSQADPNFIEFCASGLLRILGQFESKLPSQLVQKIDAALARSAWPLLQRDTKPSSTNMQVLNPITLLLIADRFNDPQIRMAATQKLTTLNYSLNTQRRIDEYVSPTYNLVAIEALAAGLAHTLNGEARALLERIDQRFWDHLSSHWHAPSGQLAGPMSRAYRTLIPIKERRIIDFYTSTNAPGACPLSFQSRFESLDSAREVKETFIPPIDRVLNSAFLGGLKPIVGTSYLTHDFSLSSVSIGDFWVQRRPILVYFGSKTAPGSLRIQFLADGKDLCDAQWVSTQSQNRVLGAIQLATNGASDHPDHKLTASSIPAEELSLRVSLEGIGADCQYALPSLDKPYLAITLPPSAGRVGPNEVRIWLPRINIGLPSSQWTAHRDKSGLILDMAFSPIPENSLNVSKLLSAAIMVGVEITRGQGPGPITTENNQADLIDCKWGNLSLATPIKPCTIEQIQLKSFASPQ